MVRKSDDGTLFASAMRRSRTLLMTLGIVMIIAGAGAIAFPYFSTLGVTVCVGVMLIIAGLAQGIGAFSQAKWTGTLLGLIIAALWLFAGGYLLVRPLEGVFILTVFLAMIFLIDGILKVNVSFRIRPKAGWGWIFFDAIASVVLGVLLWWQLPSSALWALGIIAGVRVIVSGWTLLIVPIAVGRIVGDKSSTRNTA